jgi:hypothetical protein
MGYSVVALIWTFTGAAVPIKNHDDGDSLALLKDLPDNVGAPLFAALALIAVAVGVAMSQVRFPVPPWWRRFALAFGAVLSVALLVAVPDMRLLAIVGYLPMIIIVGPFDAELRAEVADALTVIYLNQLAAVIGGLLWAAATVVFARRSAGTCTRCGRGERQSAWSTRAAAARWGQVAAYAAMIVPLGYALTRWVWALGVPMGVDKDFFAEATEDGTLWAGAWLGSFALVGALLTLGLVQRWGEVFPRWMPVVRGRRVPIGLAVIPASVVSVLLAGGGVSLIKGAIAEDMFSWDEWAAVGPTFFLPVWGIALAVATLGYYLRRRGQCPRCGHGSSD